MNFSFNIAQPCSNTMCHALLTHTKHKQTYLKISKFCKQLMASHCTKTLTHLNSKHSLIKRWHETPLSRWQLKYCDSTRWFLWRYSEVFDSCVVNQPWVMILIKPQWASLLRNGIVLRRSRLMAYHEVGLMVELASVDCINCACNTLWLLSQRPFKRAEIFHSQNPSERH